MPDINGEGDLDMHTARALGCSESGEMCVVGEGHTVTGWGHL